MQTLHAQHKYYHYQKKKLFKWKMGVGWRRIGWGVGVMSDGDETD